MIKNDQIHNLWPILVGQFFNPEHNLIKNDLINFFKEYEEKNSRGNSQLRDKNYAGNFNLYQSNYNLHTEKNNALQNLLRFIASSILKTISEANKNKLDQLENKTPQLSARLIETWFIRYNDGGLVYPHKHDGCSWSCIYYVQANKDSKSMNGSTYFMRPYSGSSKIDFGSKYMEDDQIMVNAEEGKLLVFPSHIYHGSHPFEGDINRIIVSANAIIELKE